MLSHQDHESGRFYVETIFLHDKHDIALPIARNELDRRIRLRGLVP